VRFPCQYRTNISAGGESRQRLALRWSPGPNVFLIDTVKSGTKNRVKNIGRGRGAWVKGWAAGRADRGGGDRRAQAQGDMKRQLRLAATMSPPTRPEAACTSVSRTRVSRRL